MQLEHLDIEGCGFVPHFLLEHMTIFFVIFTHFIHTSKVWSDLPQHIFVIFPGDAIGDYFLHASNKTVKILLDFDKNAYKCNWQSP